MRSECGGHRSEQRCAGLLSDAERGGNCCSHEIWLMHASKFNQPDGVVVLPRTGRSREREAGLANPACPGDGNQAAIIASEHRLDHVEISVPPNE